jgi:hypothetical protein
VSSSTIARYGNVAKSLVILKLISDFRWASILTGGLTGATHVHMSFLFCHFFSTIIDAVVKDTPIFV